MKTFKQIDLEIDELVKDRFFYNETDFNHKVLCHLFSDGKFEELWKEYWNKFNRNIYGYINYYIHWDDFYDDNYLEINALTRLMVIEDFKLYCYEHRKRL